MSFESTAYAVFFSVLGVVFVIGAAAAFGNVLALRILHAVVKAEPTEVRGLLVACLYFFCTLASSFTLRPIRDAMAAASGASKLPYLFTATLTAMVLFHPVYSSFVAKFPLKKFLPVTYGFFALNLVAFYVLWKSGANEIWTGRAFYVWHAVFNVFMTSVFWSVMADTFHTSQAKRLFGFIGVGGTIGAVSGSMITAAIVKQVGPESMLLVSVALLIVATTVVVNFPTVPRIVDGTTVAASQEHQKVAVGGSPLAGIVNAFRSPYIAGIACFLLLFTIGSTFLYSTQTTVIAQYSSDRATQTQFLARMELMAQLLAAFTQAFITARAIRIGGIGLTLSAVPMVSIIGFSMLGMSAWGVTPLFWTFVVVTVVRRASDFSLTQPSRKILFTVLSREDKYKASSFVETSVYRLGDQIGAWGFLGLTTLGLSLSGIAWVAVPLSVIFLALGLWLARRQKELAATQVGIEAAAALTRTPRRA